MATVSTMGLWRRGEGQSSTGEGEGLRRAKAWNENGLRDRKRERRPDMAGDEKVRVEGSTTWVTHLRRPTLKNILLSQTREYMLYSPIHRKPQNMSN